MHMGVALAASVLIAAPPFHAAPTPEVKQTEVRRHGGSHVEIILHGDCYDETADAPTNTRKRTGAPLSTL